MLINKPNSIFLAEKQVLWIFVGEGGGAVQYLPLIAEPTHGTHSLPGERCFSAPGPWTSFTSLTLNLDLLTKQTEASTTISASTAAAMG